MILRGKQMPVFSGFISGCEVNVPLGSACEFFVQARNDAGLSEPSARVSIKVPSEPKALPVSRGGKPGGPYTRGGWRMLQSDVRIYGIKKKRRDFAWKNNNNMNWGE